MAHIEEQIARVYARMILEGIADLLKAIALYTAQHRYIENIENEIDELRQYVPELVEIYESQISADPNVTSMEAVHFEGVEDKYIAEMEQLGIIKIVAGRGYFGVGDNIYSIPSHYCHVMEDALEIINDPEIDEEYKLFLVREALSNGMKSADFDKETRRQEELAEAEDEVERSLADEDTEEDIEIVEEEDKEKTEDKPIEIIEERKSKRKDQKDKKKTKKSYDNKESAEPSSYDTPAPTVPVQDVYPDSYEETSYGTDQDYKSMASDEHTDTYDTPSSQPSSYHEQDSATFEEHISASQDTPVEPSTYTEPERYDTYSPAPDTYSEQSMPSGSQGYNLNEDSYRVNNELDLNEVKSQEYSHEYNQTYSQEMPKEDYVEPSKTQEVIQEIKESVIEETTSSSVNESPASSYEKNENGSSYSEESTEGKLPAPSADQGYHLEDSAYVVGNDIYVVSGTESGGLDITKYEGIADKYNHANSEKSSEPGEQVVESRISDAASSSNEVSVSEFNEALSNREQSGEVYRIDTNTGVASEVTGTGSSESNTQDVHNFATLNKEALTQGGSDHSAYVVGNDIYVVSSSGAGTNPSIVSYKDAASGYMDRYGGDTPVPASAVEMISSVSDGGSSVSVDGFDHILSANKNEVYRINNDSGSLYKTDNAQSELSNAVHNIVSYNKNALSEGRGGGASAEYLDVGKIKGNGGVALEDMKYISGSGVKGVAGSASELIGLGGEHFTEALMSTSSRAVMSTAFGDNRSANADYKFISGMIDLNYRIYKKNEIVREINKINIATKEINGLGNKLRNSAGKGDDAFQSFMDRMGAPRIKNNMSSLDVACHYGAIGDALVDKGFLMKQAVEGKEGVFRYVETDKYKTLMKGNINSKQFKEVQSELGSIGININKKNLKDVRNKVSDTKRFVSLRHGEILNKADGDGKFGFMLNMGNDRKFSRGSHGNAVMANMNEKLKIPTKKEKLNFTKGGFKKILSYAADKAGDNTIGEMRRGMSYVSRTNDVLSHIATIKQYGSLRGAMNATLDGQGVRVNIFKAMGKGIYRVGEQMHNIAMVPLRAAWNSNPARPVRNTLKTVGKNIKSRTQFIKNGLNRGNTAIRKAFGGAMRRAGNTRIGRAVGKTFKRTAQAIQKLSNAASKIARLLAKVKDLLLNLVKSILVPIIKIELILIAVTIVLGIIVVTVIYVSAQMTTFLNDSNDAVDKAFNTGADVVTGWMLGDMDEDEHGEKLGQSIGYETYFYIRKEEIKWGRDLMRYRDKVGAQLDNNNRIESIPIEAFADYDGGQFNRAYGEFGTQGESNYVFKNLKDYITATRDLRSTAVGETNAGMYFFGKWNEHNHNITVSDPPAIEAIQNLANMFDLAGRPWYRGPKPFKGVAMDGSNNDVFKWNDEIDGVALVEFRGKPELGWTSNASSIISMGSVFYDQRVGDDAMEEEMWAQQSTAAQTFKSAYDLIYKVQNAANIFVHNMLSAFFENASVKAAAGNSLTNKIWEGIANFGADLGVGEYAAFRNYCLPLFSCSHQEEHFLNQAIFLTKYTEKKGTFTGSAYRKAYEESQNTNVDGETMLDVISDGSRLVQGRSSHGITGAGVEGGDGIKNSGEIMYCTDVYNDDSQPNARYHKAHEYHNGYGCTRYDGFYFRANDPENLYYGQGKDIDVDAGDGICVGNWVSPWDEEPSTIEGAPNPGDYDSCGLYNVKTLYNLSKKGLECWEVESLGSGSRPTSTDTPPDDIVYEGVKFSEVYNGYTLVSQSAALKEKLKSVAGHAGSWALKLKPEDESLKIIKGCLVKRKVVYKEDEEGNKTDEVDHYEWSWESVKFTHNCAGETVKTADLDGEKDLTKGDHAGYYCGGHLILRVRGLVFGFEYDDLKNQVTIDPSASKNDYGGQGVKGKVAPGEWIPKASAVDFLSFVSTDGSIQKYTMQAVQNMSVVISAKTDSVDVDEEKFYQSKDIFDIDMSIKRDASMYPKFWEGWTSDNMERAFALSQGNYLDMYGIDDYTYTIHGYQRFSETDISERMHLDHDYKWLLGGIDNGDDPTVVETFDYGTLSDEDKIKKYTLDHVWKAMRYVGEVGYSQSHHSDHPIESNHITDCSGFASNIWGDVLCRKDNTTGALLNTSGLFVYGKAHGILRNFSDGKIMPGDIVLSGLTAEGNRVQDVGGGGSAHALIYYGKVNGKNYCIDCSSGSGIGDGNVGVLYGVNADPGNVPGKIADLKADLKAIHSGMVRLKYRDLGYLNKCYYVSMYDYVKNNKDMWEFYQFDKDMDFIPEGDYYDYDTVNDFGDFALPEGVENEAVYNAFLQAGCDAAQAYAAVTAYSAVIQLGGTPESAIGFANNITFEGRLGQVQGTSYCIQTLADLTKYGARSGGLGMCQWTYKDRKLGYIEAYRNYAAQHGITSFTAEDRAAIEGAYLMKEIREKYSGLLNCTDAVEASKRVTLEFERPANMQQKAAQRAERAAKIAKILAASGN